MALNHDFRDLFAALNAAEARYLLIGGYAVAFHGRPRYTKDLDVWVDASPENAARVWKALTDFGAPLASVGLETSKLRGWSSRWDFRSTESAS